MKKVKETVIKVFDHFLGIGAIGTFLYWMKAMGEVIYKQLFTSIHFESGVFEWLMVIWIIVTSGMLSGFYIVWLINNIKKWIKSKRSEVAV